MVEKPKYCCNGCSCSEASNRGTFNDYPAREYTIMLNGGKGLPLTGNAEGEEIV